MARTSRRALVVLGDIGYHLNFMGGDSPDPVLAISAVRNLLVCTPSYVNFDCSQKKDITFLGT